MSVRGSALRAEGNLTLRTSCASCGRSVSTETGHAHPLDGKPGPEIHALFGERWGVRTIFPVCSACLASGWQPPRVSVSPPHGRGRAQTSAGTLS